MSFLPPKTSRYASQPHLPGPPEQPTPTPGPEPSPDLPDEPVREPEPLVPQRDPLPFLPPWHDPVPGEPARHEPPQPTPSPGTPMPFTSRAWGAWLRREGDVVVPWQTLCNGR